MSLGTSVVRNTAVQFIARGFGTLLGVVAIGVVTRTLGPDGFGAYTTVTSFLQVFGVLVDFGLTIVCLQLLSEPGASEERILGNTLSLRLLTALLFLGIAPLVSLLFPYSADIRSGILLTTLSFLAIALHQILITLFQKRMNMKAAAGAELAGRVALVAGVLVAGFLQAGLLGMLAATTAANVIQLLITYLAARRLTPIRLLYERKMWARILTLSWPIGLSIAFNLIYLRADAVILSVTRSQTELGLYGAAYRVIDVLTVLPFLFMGLLLPHLVAAWKQKEAAQFTRLVQRAQDFLLLIILPIVVGGVVLGNPLMALVGGPAFAASGPYLGILLFGVLMIFWGTVWSHSVVALELQRRMLPYYAVNAGLALLLYLWLIPSQGAWAAASVTVLSEAAIAISAAVVVTRHAGVRISWQGGGRSAVAALLMGAGLLFFSALGWHILVLLPIGALLYAGLAVLCGAIDKKDLARFRRPFTGPGSLLS